MKKQKPKPVWIVEILEESGWRAYWSCYYNTRSEGLHQLKFTKIDNPEDKFRLKKYVRR